jgi:hypothetical protein
VFADNCVPTWPAAWSKHLSEVVPTTLIRIAELHVMFCTVENRDESVLIRLACHSRPCACILVAERPQSI